MLRLIVLVLLLANAGYYLFSTGWLRGWGLAPASDAEPQRLQQQIEPQRLRLLPAPGQASSAAAADAASSVDGAAGNGADSAAAAPADAPINSAIGDAPLAGTQAVASAATAPAASTACLQAGSFDVRQTEALRRALADWPQGSWQLVAASLPGRWMVYMGRFADDEALSKKRAELRALKISFDRPAAALEPGLSLGRFPTEEAAQRGLAQLLSQGVRTARVVQERADAIIHTLRLPTADEALRARAEGLKTVLGGKPLRACD
ncbi:hypothetical protein MASR1M59_02070 [Melaminivora sp.]